MNSIKGEMHRECAMTNGDASLLLLTEYRGDFDDYCLPNDPMITFSRESDLASNLPTDLKNKITGSLKITFGQSFHIFVAKSRWFGRNLLWEDHISHRAFSDESPWMGCIRR